MFIHLHTHSYYSFLEGLASPESLAQAAAREGMPALALTDHRGLSGAVEFYQACLEQGIRPILGLQIDLLLPPDLSGAAGSRPDWLVLLAMDMVGWGSLCRLSSALQASEPAAPLPGLDFGTLEQHSGGLICLAGGSKSLTAELILTGQERVLSSYLERLAACFPDRLYLSLQRHSPEDRRWNRSLASLAKQLHLPLAATHHIHYLDAEQADLQRLVGAMRLNLTLEALPPQAAAPPGASFIPADEMQQRFADLPQALAAAEEIASRCRLELPIGVPHFPQVPLPQGATYETELRRKALEGAASLYARQPSGEIPEIVRQRLEHELETIETCGYAALFLIMEEIMQFARKSGVPVSSRGSAASSLVAHCLKITSPDPMRLNLYFERFLNPARATPPDIDTDLCSRRRDKVIHHVYHEYGEARVAMVCTINCFRRRSALREVAKAYGCSSEEIKKMTDSLPHRWWGPRSMQDDEAPFAELAQQYPSPRYQKIFQDAAALLETPRHLSIHPGGMVIAPGELTDLVPAQMAPKGVRITQFDLESVERLGLVKIDLLGIRGLTVLGDVAQAIHASRPESHPDLLGVLDAIPEDDLPTAETIRSGRTIGCFQIESPGMRATLKEIQAQSVDDLMIALALYRPGPLTGGLKDAFVHRHRGDETPSQIHPALEPLLSDTYGVILYQEQVLRIAHELAGLSLADADLLRRAMSHFDPGKQMQTLKKKFIAGALARNGVPEATAEQIWELMAAFAGYGFPKAHAASYAVVGWRAAWCKTHYPALFMAAVLANWGGYYGQRIYLTEARRLGLRLRPPHINHARHEFSVAYPDGEAMLFMGLDQVRELTRRTQARILRQRPFHSLADFLTRVDPRPAEAENLIRCGALSGLGSIPALLQELKGGWRGGQIPLFSLEALTEGEAGGDPEWSLEERVQAQEAILGVGVDAHPLELAQARVESAGACSIVEAASQLGRKVRVAGMRQTWRRTQTVRGERVYFMGFEDLDGMLDVIIFSDVYQRCRVASDSTKILVVEGLVEFDQVKVEPFIRAENIYAV